jgi:hypothetical protein
MICEFQKQYAIDYATKTTTTLQEATDKRKIVNEKKSRTALDNTTNDIQKVRDDSDDTR